MNKSNTLVITVYLLLIAFFIFGFDTASNNYDPNKVKHKNIVEVSENTDDHLKKSSESIGNETKKENEPNGPTLKLSYSKDKIKKNPLADFMYFVPLISPVDVTSETSENSQQVGYIISCQRQENPDSFKVSCEFRMQGKGSHINDFDNSQMIVRSQKGIETGEPLKNIMDYIRFEGEGYGQITIWGKIDGSKRTVTEVEVRFNAREAKSPVYVGLYSVKYENGEYKYENSYGKKVARINVLKFEKTSHTPRMELEVDSVGKNIESLGFWERVVGRFANFFIKPIEITEIGNESMLELGWNIYNQKNKFTFPKAENLKEKSGTQ